LFAFGRHCFVSAVRILFSGFPPILHEENRNCLGLFDFVVVQNSSLHTSNELQEAVWDMERFAMGGTGSRILLCSL